MHQFLRYNGRLLQNDAKVTTAWFDAKQANNLSVPPPSLSSSSSSSSQRQNKRASRTDTVSTSTQDNVRVVTLSTQTEVSESDRGAALDSPCLEDSCSNTPSHRRSRRSSLSSQDVGREESDCGDRPESQVSSYSCSSSSREKGYSRERAVPVRRNRASVTDGAASGYYNNARRVTDDRERSTFNRAERKRRASSPAMSYSKRTREEKSSSDNRRGNTVFERLGPSQKRKECRIEPVSKSPSPKSERPRTRRYTSRASRERSHSPYSRDRDYGGSSKTGSGSSGKTRQTDEERRLSRSERHQSDDHKEKGRNERKSSRDGRRTSEMEGRKEREVKERKEEEKEEKEEKVKKRQRTESEADSEGEKSGFLRRESKNREVSEDNEPQEKSCSERDTHSGKKGEESERGEEEEEERGGICNISWDEANHTADEMDTVCDRESDNRASGVTVDPKIEQTTETSSGEEVAADGGKKDHTDIHTKKEGESVQEQSVVKALGVQAMKEENDDSVAERCDHKDSVTHAPQSVSESEEHENTGGKVPMESSIQAETRVVEGTSPEVEQSESRDYEDRDVTPPLEVLQSMQNMQSTYSQPYYPAVPFPTTSALSLAAYQQLFTAQQLTMAGASTSALPFPIATQGVGVVTTPSVWPVQVASAVSPVQWQQLWLENQRVLNAVATSQSSLSPSCAGGGITGPTSQIIGTGVETNGANVQSIRTGVEKNGANMQTIGMSVQTTESGVQVASPTVQPSGDDVSTALQDTSTTHPVSLSPSSTPTPSSEVKSGTVAAENRRPSTAAPPVQNTSSQTAPCHRAEEEKRAESQSDVAPPKLTISSLMSGQTRRPDRRRRMDGKCRAQYKEMMAEFRSHASMLATATKIMIRYIQYPVCVCVCVCVCLNH